MQRILAGIACALVPFLLAACERKGDLAGAKGQAMPVGTRNNGEGPNPDTKSRSVRNGDAGAADASAAGGKVPH
jgi:hypothetical protein